MADHERNYGDSGVADRTSGSTHGYSSRSFADSDGTAQTLTVTCPFCLNTNREGTSHCAQCGLPILTQCTACEAVNQPVASCCYKCGASLHPIGSAGANLAV